MKSPKELAQTLAQQWQRADWRERQLLGGSAAWPLVLPIGLPGSQVFLSQSRALQQHLQQWRDIELQGLGTVLWQERNYRGASEAVTIPTHWQLEKPTQYLSAISQLKATGHAQLKAEYSRLSQLIAAIDRPGFRRLLVRRLAQWQKTATKDIITAAQLVLQLEPGCAQGRPLRALSVAGNDSKFFERHTSLLTMLLDEQFDGEVSRQGLNSFLGAPAEGEHWLLVVPLAAGMLPFSRQRVPASELQVTALPAKHILLVENERCLHQLPQPLENTIAILGAGLNLGWLSAEWLQHKQVAYWGDLDTWGLNMLSTAIHHLPHLRPLLMDQPTFDAHQHLAVNEPVHADTTRHASADIAALDSYLRDQERGRLEQEFLPDLLVKQTVLAWTQLAAIP